MARHPRTDAWIQGCKLRIRSCDWLSPPPSDSIDLGSVVVHASEIRTLERLRGGRLSVVTRDGRRLVGSTYGPAGLTILCWRDREDRFWCDSLDRLRRLRVA